MVMLPPITLGHLATEFHNTFSNWYILSFILLVILDLLLGNTKAFVTKTVNSTIGINGLLKHCTVLLTILTLYFVSDLANQNWLGLTILALMSLQYCNSCVENWVSMGLPFPKKWRRALQRLTDDDGELIDFAAKNKDTEMIDKIMKNDKRK